MSFQTSFHFKIPFPKFFKRVKWDFLKMGRATHFHYGNCKYNWPLHFEIHFSNFTCMFLNPNFFPIWIKIVLIHYIWETSINKLEKHSVTKNCSNLSVFEKIVLVIEKNFWSSRLNAENLKIFRDHWNNLFKQWNFW